MAQVEISKLTKRFGLMVAVDSIDLTIEHGHLVALLGPSGCGKTTALRMIAGLEHEDAGDIRIDDHSMRGIPPWERDLGFMFQNYALFPHMRVSENIAYGLRLRRWPQDRTKKRVEEVSSFLAISGLLDRYPRQLSGGQQQRVAIARAITKNPDLLLCDEPTGALDYETGKQVLDALRNFNRDLGKTVLVITHNAAIGKMADKIIYIRDGRIDKVETNPHPVSAGEVSW